MTPEARRSAERRRDGIITLGLLLLSVGFALVSPALGLIVPGSVLLVFGVLGKFGTEAD